MSPAGVRGGRRAVLETSAGSVSARYDGPESAECLVVLAHGAGGGLDSDFMSFMAEGLASQGLLVCRFSFAYAERGRRTPDRQPVLVATYSEVVATLAPIGESKRLVLGGKSLGGRIASHVVAEGLASDGLVFLGYPLHPPGKPERVRDAHLRSIETPMLFVEGTRDPFCPLETLAAVRAHLEAPTEVVVIEGGDHSLKVPKSSGRSTKEAWAEAASAVASWVRTGSPG